MAGEEPKHQQSAKPTSPDSERPRPPMSPTVEQGYEILEEQGIDPEA